MGGAVLSMIYSMLWALIKENKAWAVVWLALLFLIGYPIFMREKYFLDGMLWASIISMPTSAMITCLLGNKKLSEIAEREKEKEAKNDLSKMQ